MIPKPHPRASPWGMMLWNRSICYYMIVLQISKASGHWFSRSEGLKNFVIKLESMMQRSGNNKSSLYFCTCELKGDKRDNREEEKQSLPTIVQFWKCFSNIVQQFSNKSQGKFKEKEVNSFFFFFLVKFVIEICILTHKKLKCMSTKELDYSRYFTFNLVLLNKLNCHAHF